MFFLLKKVLFIGTILFPNVAFSTQPLDQWVECETKPLMTKEGETQVPIPSYLKSSVEKDGSLRFTVRSEDVFRHRPKEYYGIAVYEGRYFEDVNGYRKLKHLYKWNWELYDSIFTTRPSIWYSSIIPLDVNEQLCQTPNNFHYCQSAKIGYSFATLWETSNFSPVIQFIQSVGKKQSTRKVLAFERNSNRVLELIIGYEKNVSYADIDEFPLSRVMSNFDTNFSICRKRLNR